MDFPLVAQQGSGYSTPLNAQRTVNLYPVLDPAGKRKVALYGTPGCAEWLDTENGPVRGSLTLNGVGYVVAGQKAFKITHSPAAATEIGTLNTDRGPVTIVTNGLQVLIADGEGSCDYLDGYGIIKPGGSFYVYDIDAETFAEAVYPPINSREAFYITSLADFTTVDALDFASAESSPDDLIRVFCDHGELMLFGSTSIEPWQNTGAQDFPFARLGSTRIERGLAGRHAVAKCDNSIFMLGDDLIPYRLDGYQPVRIGTEQVEFSIGRMTRTDDAEAFSYDQEGHKYFVLRFPTAGVTWLFDVATQLWHERSSRGVAWRATCHLVLGKAHLIGDAFSGKLLQMRTDLYAEDGEDLIALHVLPSAWSDMRKLNHNRFELDIEAGVGLESGLDPQIVLDWSDDGGRTWSNSLQRSAGKIGQYRRRAIWTRLGSSHVRNYRIRMSDPVKRVFTGASLEAPVMGY